MPFPLQVVLNVIFGRTEWLLIAGGCLQAVGLAFLFRKCRVPWWLALIPCVNRYQLGKCGDREPEGRYALAIAVLIRIVTTAFLFLPQKSVFLYIGVAVALSLSIAALVYAFRIGDGLCEVFGRRRRWIILWVLVEPLTALLWGLSPAFMPRYTVEDMEREVETAFSDGLIARQDEGLTVNLEERTDRNIFRKEYLLRDIRLNIRPGSLVLLLGGSGAGKTTFIKALNGYEPAKAEIILDGRDVYRNFRDMKHEIGYVPQLDRMRKDDSVQRTLEDAAKLRLPLEIPAEERRERVREMMEVFGLGALRRTRVGRLSEGQKKRLSIAMEMVSDPMLFILDEPDNGLDGVMARELMEQLRRIADQGKIVIVTTCSPDRVIDLFDSVLVLARDANGAGRLAFYGSTEEARAFFGREKMDDIVRCVNRTAEGGEGRADEFIAKYVEGRHA